MAANNETPSQDYFQLWREELFRGPVFYTSPKADDPIGHPFAPISYLLEAVKTANWV